MLNSTFIGNRIAEARKNKNLSQAELAGKIAISPQAVGKWERGESLPDITMLVKLAHLLGVDLNYFSNSFESVLYQDPANATLGVSKSAHAASTTKTEWNMSNSCWSEADFSGLKGLAERFSSADIRKCLFVNSDLSDLSLTGNSISECDFSGSGMRTAKISGSSIRKSNFTGANFTGACIENSDLQNCELVGTNFTGVKFQNSGVRKSSWRDAVLSGTAFTGTTISEATFSGVIENCSFENCGFKSVTFENATIRNSFFKNNRKLNRVAFVNCAVDKLTFAFLKSNGANLADVTLLLEKEHGH